MLCCYHFHCDVLIAKPLFSSMTSEACASAAWTRNGEDGGMSGCLAKPMGMVPEKKNMSIQNHHVLIQTSGYSKPSHSQMLILDSLRYPDGLSPPRNRHLSQQRASKVRLIFARFSEVAWKPTRTKLPKSLDASRFSTANLKKLSPKRTSPPTKKKTP